MKIVCSISLLICLCCCSIVTTQAQTTKTTTITNQPVSKPTIQPSPSEPEGKITIVINGVRYTSSSFADCAEYKSFCIAKLGAEKGAARYEKDQCQNANGFSVLIPKCAQAAFQRVANDKAATLSLFAELFLDEAKFCTKYATTVQAQQGPR